MEAVSPKKQIVIDVLSDVFRLTKSLLDESERASVILGAARLDVDLEKLLKQVLLPHPGGSDPLFEGDRMLGTFSAKIALAYRLGLINSEFEHALQMVRKIRNDFAHQLESESLSSPRQKGRVTELVRAVQNSDMYKTGVQAFQGAAKSIEHVQFVAAISRMVVELHQAVPSFSRANFGRPLKLD
ncbi:MAG: hypothetical protein ACXWJK_08895 [Burkholderiaceae bacterium]